MYPCFFFFLYTGVNFLVPKYYPDNENFFFLFTQVSNLNNTSAPSAPIFPKYEIQLTDL